MSMPPKDTKRFSEALWQGYAFGAAAYDEIDAIKRQLLAHQVSEAMVSLSKLQKLFEGCKYKVVGADDG